MARVNPLGILWPRTFAVTYRYCSVFGCRCIQTTGFVFDLPKYLPEGYDIQKITVGVMVTELFCTYRQSQSQVKHMHAILFGIMRESICLMAFIQKFSILVLANQTLQMSSKHGLLR